MASQYEVEHGIKPTAESTSRRRRQVDMSSFTSHLHQLTSTDESQDAHRHHNPHAVPTPVDIAALFRLLQDQMDTLARSAPSEENRNLLWDLFQSLESDIQNPPTTVQGVSQEYIDSLERVPRRRIKPDESCPICAEKYLDDQYCLVVELPCHQSHRFDLECVAPWLLAKGTCPLCRKDLTKKKEVVVEDDEEDEDPNGMYG
ncbi:hypothetical protein VTK73DRAFT_8734 [Phialemonium thermophilum]|uniref:RING-type domain-containing protein n=1 Tax=Phialemonium thermophilum TaxID=223376 RepID=A0ABR3W6Q1_9PEZI